MDVYPVFAMILVQRPWHCVQELGKAVRSGIAEKNSSDGIFKLGEGLWQHCACNNKQAVWVCPMRTICKFPSIGSFLSSVSGIERRIGRLLLALPISDFDLESIRFGKPRCCRNDGCLILSAYHFSGFYITAIAMTVAGPELTTLQGPSRGNAILIGLLIPQVFASLVFWPRCTREPCYWKAGVLMIIH